MGEWLGLAREKSIDGRNESLGGETGKAREVGHSFSKLKMHNRSAVKVNEMTRPNACGMVGEGYFSDKNNK
jgi:hypothetical protein